MVQRRPILVMASLAVIAVVIAVAWSSTIPRSRWQDPGAHLVDGYWLGAETVCPFDEPALCVPRIDAAIQTLSEQEPAASVVARRLARPAQTYFDETGQATMYGMSGCCSYHVAILELADGTRRLIGVTCAPSPDGDGERCFVQGDSIGATRVGEEPWLVLPGDGS